MERKNQNISDTELLWAHLDGELSEQEAVQLQDRLERESALRKELAELEVLDRTMDAWAVPPVRPDLSEQIIATACRGMPIRWVRWAIPASAVAAAVVLAVALWRAIPGGGANIPQDPADTGVVEITSNKPPIATHEELDLLSASEADAVDEFAREQLVFLQDCEENYDVLENLDTLEAIDQLLAEASGT